MSISQRVFRASPIMVWPSRTCILVLAVFFLAAISGCEKANPPKPLEAKAASPQTPSQQKTFTVVKLKPSGGSLASILKVEVQKAKKLGRKPFVEFFADWCEPCKALRRSLNDPLMVDAFNNTYIIQLNADNWHSKLSGTGFSASAVPVFFEIDENGKPSGRKIDGGAWGANIPSNMAPPLKKFFRK